MPNAITIPAQAMFQKSGQNVAYVWRRDEFEERTSKSAGEAETGSSIAKGVNAGEQVALQDPSRSDFEGVRESQSEKQARHHVGSIGGSLCADGRRCGGGAPSQSPTVEATEVPTGLA